MDFDGTFVTSLIGLESVGHVAGPLERVHALTGSHRRDSPFRSPVHGEHLSPPPECNPPAAVVKLLHRIVIALCLSVVVREEFTSLQNPNIASVRKL